MSASLYTPIVQLPVPALIPEQLSQFTIDSIRAQVVADFNVQDMLQVLEENEGKRVIGADFGGDKGETKLFVVRGGQLEVDESYEDYVQSTHAAGYLASMKKTAEFASMHNIPVGVSWGAPLDGTKPLFHPKASELLRELDEEFSGDFKNVIPTMTSCINDGPAGLISAAVQVAKQSPVQSILFPINGGGLGMAALVDGKVYSTEAGHVRGVTELNVYDQTTPCGVRGAEFVCVEMLGANKVGIEPQWAARHGHMRAIEIEKEFINGNVFAGELYDHSAFVISHMIVGTAQSLGVDLTDDITAVVGHGGGFKFPDYDSRVAQIVGQYLGATPRLAAASSYGNVGSNACLEGAALAALLKLS